MNDKNNIKHSKSLKKKEYKQKRVRREARV